MANDLKKFYSKDNLKRAWRWVLSNPYYKYKNYFRDLYSAYDLCIDDNLSDLCKRLKDEVYEPSIPSKVYLPKSIYLMRPYTLLTIEDQIVYQAFINIIAEYHDKEAKKKYYKTVFGNVYAGKNRTFFIENGRMGIKNILRL